MTYIVRHTPTKMDEAGRSHGSLNAPLSVRGQRMAEGIGEKLKGKVNTVFASSKRRAVQTAQHIADANDTSVKVKDALKPWNIGEFSGQKADEVNKKLVTYVKNPDKKVPGGESFNTFKDRFLGAMQDILGKGKDIAVVTHSRNDQVFASWKKAGMPRDRSINMKDFLGRMNDETPGTVKRI